MSPRRVWGWVCAHAHVPVHRRRTAAVDPVESGLSPTLEERRVELERDIRWSSKEVELLSRQLRKDRR